MTVPWKDSDPLALIFASIKPTGIQFHIQPALELVSSLWSSARDLKGSHVFGFDKYVLTRNRLVCQSKIMDHFAAYDFSYALPIWPSKIMSGWRWDMFVYQFLMMDIFIKQNVIRHADVYKTIQRWSIEGLTPSTSTVIPSEVGDFVLSTLWITVGCIYNVYYNFYLPIKNQ